MEPNISGAVAEGVSNSISALVEKAFRGIISGSKEGANIFAAKLSIGFEKYIATTRSRCMNTKTLLSPTNPISLDKAYEPADLRYKGGIIDIDKFIEMLGSEINHALITATLGAGKSFSMRYIYGRFSRPGEIDRIPIFIELRYVPFKEKTLISYIHDALEPFTNFVSEKSLVSGLRSGTFCLLLDGLDEVPSKFRRTADAQINKIASDYPSNIILVSSRPDRSRFVGWHDFIEFEVAPLSQKKVESLIARVEYDEERKMNFINKIGTGLYKSHSQILSNPLLASMMLITFQEFQEIPSKMHVFYDTAFDVLYRRHDTIKPDYQREFKSGLELQDFKRLFMTFSLISYLDRVTSFDQSSFQKYMKKAISYESISTDIDSMLYDLCSNVCIMNIEGDDINFMHRSFQEYFSALFLSRRSMSESYELIDSLLGEASTGEFFGMLIDIDSEEFERKYLNQKILTYLRNSQKQKVLRIKPEYILKDLLSEN